MNKRLFLLVIFACLLLSFAQSWPLISGGVNIYYGETGFLFGGGLGIEFAFESCFTGSKTETTMFGIGLEYIGGASLYTQTWASGMVLALTSKEGFILPPGNIMLNIGLGMAMLVLDTEYIDSWGDPDFTTSIGGALFVEAGVYYEFARGLSVMVCLRGGASLLSDSVSPFAGLTAHIGFMIPTPEEDEY